MTTLSWFRFRASGRTFILVTAALLVGLVSLLALKSLVAEDYNGDGYDDYTGEWVGYDDGTGSYDDGTGYYDDGTGYYGDDSGDSDLDGLTDGEEVAIGTDSTQADSDGDGLGDYEEVYGVEITYEYEVYSHTESSYDEATGEYSEWDVYETAYHYEVVLTDPLDPDTDGDFLPDGHEVNLSLNPLDPADGTADVDGDGLTAGEEYLLGTDPLLPDTDGDQWDDEIEVFEATDPTDPASFPTEEGEGETTTEGAGPGEEGDPNGDGGADNPGMGAGDSGAGGGGGGSASSSDTGEGGDSATGGGSSSGDTVPDGTPPDETVVPGSETNETVGNVYLVGRVATFQPGGGENREVLEMDPEFDEFETDYGSDESAWMADHPGYVSGVDGGPVPTAAMVMRQEGSPFVAKLSWSEEDHVLESESNAAARTLGPIEDPASHSPEPWSPAEGLSTTIFGSSWDGALLGSEGGMEPSSGADFRIANQQQVYPTGQWAEVALARAEPIDLPVQRTFLVRTRIDRDDSGYIPEGEPNYDHQEEIGSLTFQIPAGEQYSTSVVWSGTQVPGFVVIDAGTVRLMPAIEAGTSDGVGGIDGGANTDVVLLSVAIEEAWSDQIKDVEANGMQDKEGGDNRTGNIEKPYIFMGARDDGKGHGKLRLGSALPEDVRDRILWRFAKKGSEAPEPGSSTYEEEGKVVRVTLDNPPNADDKDFVIVFGYEENEDGNLTQAEVFGTPETNHIQNGNVTKIPYTFKIVGKVRYDKALTELLDLSQSSSIRGAVPNSADLLQSFCEKKTPENATAEAATVERDETGLTHPVGIAFTAEANPGQSITAVYGNDHLLTAAFLESTQFWNWLNGKLVEKTEEVRNHFDGLPQTETEHTFHWVFGNGELNFNNTTDLDCWMALGRAEMSSISVKARVHRHFLTLENLEVSGTAVDIYDFDYDALAFTIPGFLGFGGTKVEFTLAAELQAGYPTLGDGGRVYKHRIEIQDSDVPLPENAFRFDPPL